jgi:hypothetical protein
MNINDVIAGWLDERGERYRTTMTSPTDHIDRLPVTNGILFTIDVEGLGDLYIGGKDTTIHMTGSNPLFRSIFRMNYGFYAIDVHDPASKDHFFDILGRVMRGPFKETADV